MLVQNASQFIELSEGNIFNEDDIDLDGDFNPEPLLESLGYNISNDMINLDESAGLDEGSEFHEKTDLSESEDDDMDLDQGSQICDFSDIELPLEMDYLGQTDDCNTLGAYISKINSRVLIQLFCLLYR